MVIRQNLDNCLNLATAPWLHEAAWLEVDYNHEPPVAGEVAGYQYGVIVDWSINSESLWDVVLLLPKRAVHSISFVLNCHNKFMEFLNLCRPTKVP